MARKKKKKQAKTTDKPVKPVKKIQEPVQERKTGERKSGDFPLLQLVALIVLVIALYANTLGAPFQWDEQPLIEENPIIRDLGYFLEPSRASEYLGYDSFIRRYFSYVTFALNYAIHGTGVPGYHLVNIAIHVGSALTLFWLVTLLMGTTVLRETRLAGRDHPFAFLAAALYASHPVQTEAVTYIFQRHALLVGLLYMLSIALYLHWRQTGKLLWYALCLAAAVLAMKSKANAFTLPVMIVATEFMFFGGFKKSGDFKKRVLPLAPILLTMLIVPLTLASLHSGAEPRQAATVTETIGKYAAPTKETSSYLITQFRVIPTYLRLLLLPVGQNLDYDYPEYDTLASAPVVLSLMLLTALGLAGVFCFRAGLKAGIKGRRELLLVSWGVLWFFVTLSIESSFVRIPMVINEYRLYLPSAGIITAAVALAFVVMEGWPSINKFRPETVVLGLVIVMLSLASVHRNAQWQSEISLWGDVVRKSPGKTRGMLHLGVALEEDGQFDEALRVYNRALAIEPENQEIYYDMGVVYGKLKQNNKAFEAYRKALELNPANANAHNNLGALYANNRNYDLALEEFQAVIEIEPNNSKAHNNLSVIYLNRKQYGKALPELLSLLRTAPPNPFVHNKLGIVYGKLGQNDKAMKHYRKALALHPINKNANFNLARLLADQGKYFEAEEYAMNAVDAAPDNKDFLALADFIRKELQKPGR